MLHYALAAVLLVPSFVGAQACSADLPAGMQLESPRFLVGFRTEPETVSVGRHFSVDFAVCPKAGVTAPESVAIDAHMPEHRHGMNYKAEVVPVSSGHYRAAGLMFHMPGRWEFIFDVRSDDRTDRLTRSIVIQ